jgi:hypothetical protein
MCVQISHRRAKQECIDPRHVKLNIIFLASACEGARASPGVNVGGQWTVSRGRLHPPNVFFGDPTFFGVETFFYPLSHMN